MRRLGFIILGLLILTGTGVFAATERDLSYLTASWTSPEGVIFDQGGSRSTGTGIFDPFLRLQHSDSEQGYNTDYRLVQYDESSTANWTHALLLETIPVVMIGGSPYREIKLDINEIQNDKNAFISLDALEIYETANPMIHNYRVASSGWPTDPIFDLGDNYIKLDARLGPGSGMGDMSVYIPQGLFVNSGPYLTLYSRFGASDAGFEEWAVVGAEPMPEPASVLSMFSGLGGLVGLVLRKRR